MQRDRDNNRERIKITNLSHNTYLGFLKGTEQLHGVSHADVGDDDGGGVLVRDCC